MTGDLNRIGSGQLATRSYSPAGCEVHSTAVAATSRAHARSRQSEGMDVLTGADGTSVSNKSGSGLFVRTRSDDPACNVIGFSAGPSFGSQVTQAASWPGASTSKSVPLMGTGSVHDPLSSVLVSRSVPLSRASLLMAPSNSGGTIHGLRIKAPFTGRPASSTTSPLRSHCGCNSIARLFVLPSTTSILVDPL